MVSRVVAIWDRIWVAFGRVRTSTVIGPLGVLLVAAGTAELVGIPRAVIGPPAVTGFVLFLAHVLTRPRGARGAYLTAWGVACIGSIIEWIGVPAMVAAPLMYVAYAEARDDERGATPSAASSAPSS